MSALNIKKGSVSHSAYELRNPNGDLIESHTLAVAPMGLGRKRLNVVEMVWKCHHNGL